MSENPTLLELLQNGVHFGHRASKLHPKMKPYVFLKKNGVHVINIEITRKKLKETTEFIKKIVGDGGTILFLGTKKQAQPIIKKYAEECKMPYITERWLGGTFTNFGEIYRLIKKLTNLKEKKQRGELEKYTKKERLKFDEEIKRLEKMVGGIESVKKIPEAIYIVDLKKEKTAVAESHKKEVPIIAMCDTNVNPEKISHAIPANDDAVKSIEFITKIISEAVIDANKNKGSLSEEKDAKISKDKK